MRQLDAHPHGLAAEKRSENQSVGDDDRAKIYKIKTCIEPLKQDNLTVSENSHHENENNTQKHELGLPADVAGGVTESSFQIHQNQYGNGNRKYVPCMTGFIQSDKQSAGLFR